MAWNIVDDKAVVERVGVKAHAGVGDANVAQIRKELGYGPLDDVQRASREVAGGVWRVFCARY